MPTMKTKTDDNAAFKPGDNVYCFHGPMMYDAKLLEVENDPETGLKFFIHYNGWNKNWREWVESSRVLQYNDENKKKKEELRSLHSKQRNARNTMKMAKDDDSRKKSKKKHKSDGTVETEEDFAARIEVKLPLLDELRRQLVDDWDLITTQKKLVPLPRDPTVSKILQDYKKARSKGTPADDIVAEVVEGLKVYFDQALGTLLLYKFERPQYEAIVNENPDADMSDIYGAEHLLRLFVKIPMLLAYTNIDEESLTILVEHLTDFMSYLVKGFNDLFLNDYEGATAEYIKQAA